MFHNRIKHNNAYLSVHKSTFPNIDSPKVLVSDTWDYVDLWLKRNKKIKARFFWKQARAFYNASLTLPKESAPLTSYYCFLNATKALLESRNKIYDTMHGVTGYSSENPKTTLENEKIILKNRGVLPALINYLGYSIKENSTKKFTLLDSLYNLPFLHRAFLLTYTSRGQYPELYIPLKEIFLEKHKNNNKVWFSAELDEIYRNQYTINKLPKKFEIDKRYSDKQVIRFKKRIKWSRKASEYKGEYISYNKEVRKYLHYIHGSPLSWYIKRDEENIKNYNEYPPLVLMFVAMHRLSELARYTPDKLNKHFENKQNWLLNEFIKNASVQFIDAISSEITGLEFKIPKNSI